MRSDDTLPDQIHRLAIRQLAGDLSEADRSELVALLKASRQARRIYLEHMQDTVSLRWMLSGPSSRKAALAVAQDEAQPVFLTRGRAGMMTAVAAGIACVAAGLSWLSPASDRAVRSSPTPSSAVAMVTGVSRLIWSGDAAPSRLSRVRVGQEFEFREGTLTLAFYSGAEVKIFGPAKFSISSPKSILCSHGRVTTRVEESGKGFTIDTPKARIVDLGTEFGVDISEEGDTQVVVFQGSVDLKQPSAPETAAPESAAAWTPRTLEQGDALLLDHTGEAQRVMAVQRGDFFPTSLVDDYGRRRRAPVILDVRDNIRALESTKCYQIVWGGLREDAVGFVDREHQWNGKDEAGIPEFLLGADYVMPFNDDKFISDLRVELTLSQPATCYVFLDDNMPPPEWLRKEFQDTGLDIALDGGTTQWHKDHALGEGAGQSVDFPFSIWSRNVASAGTISLGGVNPPRDKSRSKGFNMYGIAVVPK